VASRAGTGNVSSANRIVATLHRGESGTLSPAVSGSHGCLPCALGEARRPASRATRLPVRTSGVLEWCEKPRIKCADCWNRSLIPLSDAAIYAHLAVTTRSVSTGCWRTTAATSSRSISTKPSGERMFAPSPVRAPISASRCDRDFPLGNGAHAWIFFADRVSARDARRLGTAIISHTCARTRQLKLSSYDRLFPNQDTMPKGGFGNLIALPLQRKAPEEGFTVFVDSDLRPHPDQWRFLASIQRCRRRTSSRRLRGPRAACIPWT